ncbi:MAG: hypothetical protein J5666_07355 [Bacilli bacterium]|nr:hypothetical protein [Bacilli bacterium]
MKTEKGYLTILTGKTDMGKSTITVYECGETLRLGKRALFFSYEYTQSIIYNKLISHFGFEWSQLLNLNIVNSYGLSLKTIIEIIRAKQGTINIGAIYIDYLDLLKDATFPKAKDTEEDLAQIQEICRALAALAMELNVPIILLSQVGASSDFEKAVQRLNSFTEKVEGNNVYKMFIGKGNIIDSRIDYTDIVHIILVDGYELKYFSSINIKEIYGEK